MWLSGLTTTQQKVLVCRIYGEWELARLWLGIMWRETMDGDLEDVAAARSGTDEKSTQKTKHTASRRCFLATDLCSNNPSAYSDSDTGLALCFYPDASAPPRALSNPLPVAPFFDLDPSRGPYRVRDSHNAPGTVCGCGPCLCPCPSPHCSSGLESAHGGNQSWVRPAILEEACAKPQHWCMSY